MRSMDDLLTTGRFARLAGLSVGALRHYDELDLLRPARTDPFTSYRLYGRGQLETARLIVRMRISRSCSRVYAVLGRAEPALWHARRCLAINEAAGSVDWDIASAYEAMARAYLVAGDAAEVAAWKARATAALDGIADRDDRELIEGDLATLP